MSKQRAHHIETTTKRERERDVEIYFRCCLLSPIVIECVYSREQDSNLN